MLTDQWLDRICEIVERSDYILITGQGNPDGDSIGSQLALYEILRQHKYAGSAGDPAALVISNDELPPSHYAFLPGIERVTPCEQIQQRRFDTAFILDAGRDRIGQLEPVVQRCRYTINIDHHRKRLPSQDDVPWIEPEASSVAEMVYRFLEHPAWRVELTQPMATCLYAGLIYDTGSFRYPSTSARTHEIAARMVATGIDFARIAEHLFLERSQSALYLLSAVLHDLEHTADGKIFWGTVSQALLAEVQAHPEETEGIITKYAFIKGSQVAVLFKEVSANEIKVSFRSRGALDVGQFAHQLDPGGGGHLRAAGCTLNGALREVKDFVIEALQHALRAGISSVGR